MAYDVYFFFMLKYLYNPLLYIPSICSKLICFKVQMTLIWCSFGLRHPMKKIFEPEQDLNYFDKFMPLNTKQDF